jgi:hypothetical protein
MPITVSRLARAEAATAALWIMLPGTAASMRASTIAAPQRPDLIISALTNPDGLRKGSCSRFEVTIENPQANGTSQTIAVRLQIHFSNGGDSQYLRTIDGIGPKTSRTVSFQGVDVPSYGAASYVVTVNPDATVPETVIDEHNSASGSATVVVPCAGSLPPATPRGFDLVAAFDDAIQRCNRSEACTIRVRFLNHGPESSPAARVTLERHNVDGSEALSADVGGVQPLSALEPHQTSMLTFVDPRLTPGTYTYRLVYSPVINDLNNANHRVTRSLVIR